MSSEDQLKEDIEEIVLNIRNFDSQEEIFKHPARYKIVGKGRRFGLTRGGANDYIKDALDSKFRAGFWGDTINSNIDRYVERYFLPELKKLDGVVRYKWAKQQKTLYIKDSYIDFRSADNPENWEGFGYDKYFLNEAGIILRNEYLWYNAVQPMLLEFKPRGVIGGTPKGKGLFYDLALKGMDKNNTEYEFFHRTTYDNPYLDPKEIDRMRDDMPFHIAQQEIYGQFLDDTGTIFRNLSAVMRAVPCKPEHGHQYTIGVDLAKVQDFTVIAVYDRATLKQVYQDRFKDLDWNFQRRKIKAISRLYNGAIVNLDATGLGDPIAEDLTRESVPVNPVKFTNETKKEMVEKLSMWIEQGRILLLDIDETRTEFTNFTYEVLPSGRIRYNAPEGGHDDIVMAHALAVKDLYYVQYQPEERKSRIRLEFEKRAGYTDDDGEDDFIIIE